MPEQAILTPEQLELLNSKPPEEMAKILAAANAGFWAEQNVLKLQSGEFSFKNHEYLEEPLNGPTNKKVRANRRCYMKAPQGGFSVAEAVSNLHGMIHGYYPQGVLHLLPTRATVEEFGKSKYGPLISRNKKAIGNYVKKGLKGSDSASMKKIGDSYLYLRSATLNPDEEGEGKSSASLSSISVDKVDFDEIELMDQEAIAKAEGRTAHSENPEFCYIFNPGGEDSGGDLIWKQSDQRHWFRRCTCTGGDLSAYTCAELEFPDCVKEYPDSNQRRAEGLHRGYIACKKCGKPLPFYTGSGTGLWIPQKPHVLDFEGYRWSHLTSIYHDPLEILEQFIDPPYGNLGDVYRLRLGLPYSSAEDKLKKDVVLRCCGDTLMPLNHTGPCAMGMDVGLLKHIVIGFKTGKEHLEIIRAAQIKSFDDAYDLCLKYGVKTGVVDIRPYEDEARRFQQKCRKVGIVIYLCQYTDNPVQEADFNEKTGLVKTYRTGILDKSHRYLSNGNIKLPRQNPTIEEYSEQCCNIEKYTDKNRNGASVMRYRACGDRKQGDHYRHTTGYFILAASKCRQYKKRSMFESEQQDCIMNYSPF